MVMNKESIFILDMIKSLRENYSWSGETHLQKALFFLNNHYPDVLDSEFVLYKHGPYSFEMHDLISSLCIYGLVEREPQPPYGPKLGLTGKGEAFLDKNLGQVDKEYHLGVQRIALSFGQKKVSELEKVATALWFKKQYQGEKEADLAEQINDIKPHISVEEAKRSFKDLEGMLADQSVHSKQ